jgi:hypothetical protein
VSWLHNVVTPEPPEASSPPPTSAVSALGSSISTKSAKTDAKSRVKNARVALFRNDEADDAARNCTGQAEDGSHKDCTWHRSIIKASPADESPHTTNKMLTRCCVVCQQDKVIDQYYTEHEPERCMQCTNAAYLSYFSDTESRRCRCCHRLRVLAEFSCEEWIHIDDRSLCLECQEPTAAAAAATLHKLTLPLTRSCVVCGLDKSINLCFTPQEPKRCKLCAKAAHWSYLSDDQSRKCKCCHQLLVSSKFSCEEWTRVDERSACLHCQQSQSSYDRNERRTCILLAKCEGPGFHLW